MNFTGRAGQASCACAAKDRTSSATQSKIRFMNLSYMHVHSMRVASGEEALVARARTKEGKVGFGFSLRLDAEEARHLAEWHPGVRQVGRVVHAGHDRPSWRAWPSGQDVEWKSEPGF